MSGTKGRRPAFTLTEVLMAVGILGVGLTMVASIFPVAVDQSRRSRETTEAALCARSASAMIRVLRNDFVNWRRKFFVGKSGDNPYPLEANPKTPYSGYDFPGDLKVYDPAEFLYDHEDDKGNPYRSYDSTNVWGDEGSKANYVPRVFMTPVSTNGPGGGPWRVTLAICRSQGKDPPGYAWQEQWSSVWSEMGPGKYILDRTKYCGYAYMADSIKEGPTPAQHPEYVILATPSRYSQYHIKSNWFCLVGKDAEHPDAVAVYHTVLGD